MSAMQKLIEYELDNPGADSAPPQILTPIEKHGDIYFKREDKFKICDAIGAKARTAHYLITDAKNRGFRGVTTAGSRTSPQINIVATIANAMGMQCVAHTPLGKLSPELIDAQNKGAIIIQHKAGYNNVIIARSQEYASQHNYYNIPFGMECKEAVSQALMQVKDLLPNIKKIVIAVGSSMNLAGVLQGLKKKKLSIPVLGIMVGANPISRLDKYAPACWRGMVQLIKSELKYHEEEKNNEKYGIKFDPIYEAKCLKYLQPDDLFWVIGIRKTLSS